MIPRSIQQIVTAHQQKEGAGFLVRRPVPTSGLDQVDPFLMLDEVGPVVYAPGKAIGAPDHRIAALRPSPTFCRDRNFTRIRPARAS